ncbi:hypothetical protein CVT24_005291 [Panaeolus cyanescens]|uniref:Uncharacterized protein n=1 Tax=Panaeolus cyanescens TaxID=181874 RepID=A0A409WGK3_9AGAR|nr:hypothetical protein CVT24_005291 [Panaeolus cyanescens]
MQSNNQPPNTTNGTEQSPSLGKATNAIGGQQAPQNITTAPTKPQPQDPANTKPQLGHVVREPSGQTRAAGAKRTTSTNLQAAKDRSQPYIKPNKELQNQADQTDEEGHPPLHPSKLKKRDRRRMLEQQLQQRPKTKERGANAEETDDDQEQKMECDDKAAVAQEREGPTTQHQYHPDSGGYTQEELYLPDHDYNMTWDGRHRAQAPMSEDEYMSEDDAPLTIENGGYGKHHESKDDPFLPGTPKEQPARRNLFTTMQAPYTQTSQPPRDPQLTQTPRPRNTGGNRSTQNPVSRNAAEETRRPETERTETDWITEIKKRPTVTQFPNLERLAALDRQRHEKASKEAAEQKTEEINPFLDIPPETPEVMINDETMYEAISMDTLARWSGANKIGILVIVYGSRPQLNGYIQSRTIEDTVKLELRRSFPGEDAAVEVCQPWLKDNYTNGTYTPAFPFYITNISENQALHLLNIRMRATAEHAILFFPTRLPIPSQLFCIQHYNEDPTEEGRNKVEAMVRKCIRDALGQNLQELISKNFEVITNYNQESVVEIFEAMLASVRVTSFVIGSAANSRPVFSVNMTPPTESPRIQDILLAMVRSIRYETYKGVATILTTFNCNGCKGINHASDSCPLLQVPNWPTRNVEKARKPPRPNFSHSRGRSTEYARAGPSTSQYRTHQDSPQQNRTSEKWERHGGYHRQGGTKGKRRQYDEDRYD